jgi:hypothetical protein
VGVNNRLEGGQEWPGNDGSPDDAPTTRVVEQSRRVREDVQELVSALFEARSELENTLRERLTARPYLGLAAAAGVGYVLGAGISPGLVRGAVGIGGRIAFAIMMRRLAVPLTELVAGKAP